MAAVGDGRYFASRRGDHVAAALNDATRQQRTRGGDSNCATASSSSAAVKRTRHRLFYYGAVADAVSMQCDYFNVLLELGVVISGVAAIVQYRE